MKSERIVRDGVNSIEITTPPTKTTYTSGEEFDPAGMVVTARYGDGSEVAVTGYEISPDIALTSSVTEITVTFEGQEATQAITVNKIAVTGASVSRSGNNYTATVTPAGATVSYQWQRQTRTGFSWSGWSNVGTDSSTYTTSQDPVRVRVVVTGTGEYEGTITSDYVQRGF